MRWLDEGGPRRLIRNAGTLIVGNAMRGALGFVSLAVTARALDPEDFGKLVLAVAYAAIVTQVIAFQSWQAVIRFGTQALVANDTPRFMGVVKAGVALDVGAAVVAALVALGGIGLAADYLGIDGESRSVAQLFSIAILANLVGTPTGLLRIFDRYTLFITQAFLASLAKLLLVGIAYAAGGGMWEFALAWAISQVFGHLVLVSLAARELAARRFSLAMGENLVQTFRAHRELLSFFLLTNLSGTARAVRELDVPILGFLLGPGATATFKIARQFAGSLNKVIDAFFVVVYPDLARLHFKSEPASALDLARRSGLLLGALMAIVFVLFMVVGEPLVVLVLGESYRNVYPVAGWCVAGAVIWAFAHSVSPLLIVYGRQSALLLMNVVTSALYLASILMLAPSFGLLGAGAAYAGFMVLWAIWGVRLVTTTAARMQVAGAATTPSPES